MLSRSNLEIFRKVAFVVPSVWSLILLALYSVIVSRQLDYLRPPYNGSISFHGGGTVGAWHTGIFVPTYFTIISTMLTLPTMFIIDRLRTGAFTSLVVVELSWLSTLGVLWLCVASINIAAMRHHWFKVHWRVYFPGPYAGWRAVIGFCFLNMLILIAYAITLLRLAIRGRRWGYDVWTSSIKEGTFLVPPTSEPMRHTGEAKAVPSPNTDPHFSPSIGSERIPSPPTLSSTPTLSQSVPNTAQLSEHQLDVVRRLAAQNVPAPTLAALVNSMLVENGSWTPQTSPAGSRQVLWVPPPQV